MSATNDVADRAFQISITEDNGIEGLVPSNGDPRIRISNNPELRLKMKELDEDGVQCRFLAYAEEDKGLIESSCQAGSYCDPAHLEAIKHNLRLAKAFYQLEMDGDCGLIEDVITATTKELSRLQNHPELFPNEDIREEFWEAFPLQSRILEEQEASDHAHRMLQAAMVEDQEDMLTPGRDMQRKPWEQFLHNRAPGTEADLSMFPEEGSVQIIPMPASRVMITHLEEHRAIIRNIEAEREDSKPYAPSSRCYIYSKEVKQSPDGNLRSHQWSTTLLKPTLAGPMSAVRGGEMNSLETLNLDFAALNRQRVPRMWNCFATIVHERPNYGVDSEQRNEIEEGMMRDLET